MNWNEIVKKLFNEFLSDGSRDNKCGIPGNIFYKESDPLQNTRPDDITTCCGATFGAHVTWQGVWLPCNPTKKAAWTRKKNREAKLRKQDERIRKAGGIPKLTVTPADNIVDEDRNVVGVVRRNHIHNTVVFYTEAGYPHESFGSIGSHVNAPGLHYQSWIREARGEGSACGTAFHDTKLGAQNRILRALALTLKREVK